ncbi:hypothetical protein AQUCO_12300008v1 [Aquilegia coerulea]|uniref:Uncharacterized protein n=1 Tax=Aquilegia coerulea TaxID=218851 RepID=A0A2G5C1M2_AQUCA|nr:hypothetical protein AQUCO_12300008v1 [Aquilegia coerulea]
MVRIQKISETKIMSLLMDLDLSLVAMQAKREVNASGSVVSLQQQTEDTNGLKQSVIPLHKDVTKEDIDRNVDYHGWLELKKRKWKTTLEVRKKRSLGNSKKYHQSDGVSNCLALGQIIKKFMVLFFLWFEWGQFMLQKT